MLAVFEILEGEHVAAAAEGFAIFIPSENGLGFLAVERNGHAAAFVIHDPIKPEARSLKGVTQGTANAVGSVIAGEAFFEGLIDERKIGKLLAAVTKLHERSGCQTLGAKRLGNRVFAKRVGRFAVKPAVERVFHHVRIDQIAFVVRMGAVRGVFEPIAARKSDLGAKHIAGIGGGQTVIMSKRRLDRTGRKISRFADQRFRALRCRKYANDIRRALEIQDLAQTVFIARGLLPVRHHAVVGGKFNENEVGIARKQIVRATAKTEVRSRAADRRHDLRDLGFGIFFLQIRRDPCAPGGFIPFGSARALGDGAAEITDAELLFFV